MADDQRSSHPGSSNGKSFRRVSKKSTSKRRVLGPAKDTAVKTSDNRRGDRVSPLKIASLRERTVIGQEALPKTVEKDGSQTSSETFKRVVEFSEKVRSEADGSEDGSVPDVETEELAKLRCTSERTEVIAEREKRRRQRCADYPGLAFGSSIFSSDALMKFSVIGNELHNILNSQLKRVSTKVNCTKLQLGILYQKTVQKLLLKVIMKTCPSIRTTKSDTF